MKNQNVLVLDDEIGFRNEIGEYLKNNGFKVLLTGRPSEAMEILKYYDVDIALFDLKLPEMDGITLMGDVKKEFPNLQIIIMTGYADLGNVIRALRYGAVDFLKKPFKFNEIKETLDRVTKNQFLTQPGFDKDKYIADIFKGKVNIIGKSKAFIELSHLLLKIAVSADTTVLLTGESGTGKEMMARAIHRLSSRSQNNFVAVNCSSIPDELFENEFFGHVKGSYTDAKADQMGFFEAANNGTLFLDEIGELKLSLQSKLLRVLEDKYVSRIGTHKEKKVDVRIVAATNQNLEKMVSEKKFRADLYHRLNMFNIHIPPLRERKDDIPVLFNYFVNEFSKKQKRPPYRVDRRILTKIINYDFPGNVRELKNIIERAIILCNNETLTMDCFDIIEKSATSKIKNTEASGFSQLNLDAVEKICISRALKFSGNNKSKAAEILNISRQSLDRKIKKYQIQIVK